MLGCTAASLGAHAEEELPTIHTLPCHGVCANSTDAVGISQPKPAWPSQFLDEAAYVEGYVRLHYKIKTDGHVSDISVISVVGPKLFAERTVNAVKDWIYKPATLEGKVVEKCHTLLLIFNIGQWAQRGARPAIAQAYEKAIRSAKDEKWDEAQAILTEALSRPKLNLYERGMLANISSLLALGKADYWEAHRLSTEALNFSGKDLPRLVRRTLLQTRIKAASMLGDIVDALDAADEFKSEGFDAADLIVKYVGDVREKADAMPVFAMSVKIPETEQGESAYLSLYRRTFAFQDIKGSLSGFTLSCKQQAIASKITETAEWRVPKSWSECSILVRGAPGTTFKIVQANS